MRGDNYFSGDLIIRGKKSETFHSERASIPKFAHPNRGMTLDPLSNPNAEQASGRKDPLPEPLSLNGASLHSYAALARAQRLNDVRNDLESVLRGRGQGEIFAALLVDLRPSERLSCLKKIAEVLSSPQSELSAPAAHLVLGLLRIELSYPSDAERSQLIRAVMREVGTLAEHPRNREVRVHARLVSAEHFADDGDLTSAVPLFEDALRELRAIPQKGQIGFAVKPLVGGLVALAKYGDAELTEKLADMAGRILDRVSAKERYALADQELQLVDVLVGLGEINAALARALHLERLHEYFGSSESPRGGLVSARLGEIYCTLGAKTLALAWFEHAVTAFDRDEFLDLNEAETLAAARARLIEIARANPQNEGVVRQHAEKRG